MGDNRPLATQLDWAAAQWWQVYWVCKLMREAATEMRRLQRENAEQQVQIRRAREALGGGR